ncbi:MAG: hypothetical protein AB1420_14640 [Bacillota bacterium]
MPNSDKKGILFKNAHEAERFLKDVLNSLNISIMDLGSVYGKPDNIGLQIKENQRPIPLRFFTTICIHTELNPQDYDYIIITEDNDQCYVCKTKKCRPVQ